MQPTTVESTSTPVARPASERDSHRGMRQGYVVVSAIMALAVLAQVYLAGSGLFTSPQWWPMHETFGMMLTLGPLALLALLALGSIARLPWRALGLTGLLLVLVGIQPVLINAAGLKPFHVVNALLIFGLTVGLGQHVGSHLARSHAPAPAGQVR